MNVLGDSARDTLLKAIWKLSGGRARIDAESDGIQASLRGVLPKSSQRVLPARDVDE